MRYVLPIAGLLLVVGSLVGIKVAQISSLIQAGEAFAAAGPPPEAVATDLSRAMTWKGSLTTVGSIAAAQGVAISADAAGLVTRIHFDSGDVVKRGQVLVELDSRLERAQLATAEARQKLAEQTAQRTRKLFESGGLSRSQLDADESQLQTAEAEVRAVKAQLERKIVRAAFDGRLGIRAVNLGQYVGPGTMLTTLESLDSVYVDFALPQQTLPYVKPGLPVRVELDGDEMIAVEGSIEALDPAVDATTRNFVVRASVPNLEQKLRPGMFANVAVLLPEEAEVVAVPLTAVVRAPYGDSVFVVEPLEGKKSAPGELSETGAVRKARQQFVRLGERRGDFVAVVEGVRAGQELVTAGAFKLRNGAKITVNNQTRPEPKLDPRPENR